MNTSVETKQGAKEKLVHELRELFGIFLYLAVFFLVFRVYTRLMLEEYDINYFAYGLTLLKSLALAKVILTGEMIGLASRSEMRQRPLIYVTVYYAVVFS